MRGQHSRSPYLEYGVIAVLVLVNDNGTPPVCSSAESIGRFVELSGLHGGCYVYPTYKSPYFVGSIRR